MNYINIGGKERPILFGWAALYQYEKDTGRKAFADFAELAGGGLASVSVSVVVDLITAGLTCAARREKTGETFDALQVAEWVGDDQTLIDRSMAVFSDSFPTAEEDAKKKKETKSSEATT